MQVLPDQHSDATMLMGAAKKFMVAAVVGWVGAEGFLVFLRARLAEHYAQFVWYDDFMNFMETIVGVTVAGIALAAIIHFDKARHKKMPNEDASP